jgi:predicted aspartyl protease
MRGPGRDGMTSGQIAGSIYLGLWIVLIASSLALRRLPHGKIASLSAIWLAIILSLWALITVAQKWL